MDQKSKLDKNGCQYIIPYYNSASYEGSIKAVRSSVRELCPFGNFGINYPLFGINPVVDKGIFIHLELVGVFRLFMPFNNF